ncbi:hypothetical protein B0T20DRAFT_60120 [Sordaria brevicollis]|uniref:Uncharacterized protein n=1 Tax=Sordaria brevicollis TaxID=83679 RepID=A0AAE0P3D0_SORBR|nr:hypothetical protein B0T20DRAFT_60120 [Sordaria brevicollis]
MHSNIWSCSSCVAFSIMALFGQEAMASQPEAGLLERDTIHRVPKKPQITPPPQPLRLKRRGDDDLTCPVNHSLCPESMGGGCCPDQYECASDACSATTAALGTACGIVGYYYCPITAGQGCCPEGWVCDTVRGCIAPYGVTNTFTSCPASYKLCPASYNYGCCPNSMGCAIDACYSTEPFSTTLVDILTLTSGGKVITTTQISAVLTTPTPPPALLDVDNTSGAIPKFMPTSVPKVSAIPKDNKDGGGGGLKGAQLGGIIGGAIALLIIVIIAAFLIIRRLKRVESAMETSKRGSTSGYTKTSKTGASASQIAQMEQTGRFLHVRSPSDADNASADPLMFMTETSNTPGDHTTNTSSLAGTPQPGAHGFGVGRHGRSVSDAYMVSPHGTSNVASPDPNTGYFDGPSPPPTTNAHLRESVDSQSTAGLAYHSSMRNSQNQNHWRHQSNASELSADGSEITHGVGSPLVGSHARGASGGGSGLGDVPELDSSGVFAELPATTTSLARSPTGTGTIGTSTYGESPIIPINNRQRTSFGLSTASRRTSNLSNNPNSPHSPNSPHTHGRNDSTTTNSPLDAVSETTEFIPNNRSAHTSLDGFYGPPSSSHPNKPRAGAGARARAGSEASSTGTATGTGGLGFVPEGWQGSSPGAYPMGFPMISVPGYGIGDGHHAGGEHDEDEHEDSEMGDEKSDIGVEKREGTSTYVSGKKEEDGMEGKGKEQQQGGNNGKQ